MGYLNDQSVARALDTLGSPVPNAKRYIFRTGSSNLCPIYSDSGLTNMIANPMEADDDGYFDLCHLADGRYRVMIETPKGTILLDQDEIEINALLAVGVEHGHRSVGELLADDVLSYSTGFRKVKVEPTELISASGGQFTYRIAPEAASDHHLTTAGGVKLYVNFPTSIEAFGITANGNDETDQIENMFSALASGGVLTGRPGVSIVSRRLEVRNKSDFRLNLDGWVLKAADNWPVTSGNVVLEFYNCHGFQLSDLGIDGNRDNRTPAEVNAHNISVIGCTGFRFANVASDNAVVDGFYFRGTDETDSDTYCKNFRMENCKADNCYRQGASVISGYDFVFEGGAYTNSNGTAPQAGIDVEPNQAAEPPGSAYAVIRGVKFCGNTGPGLLLAQTAAARNITVELCHFAGNIDRAAHIKADNVTFKGNWIEDHAGIAPTGGGLLFFQSCSNGRATGNIFQDNSVVTAAITVDNTCDRIVLTENFVLDSMSMGLVVKANNSRIIFNTFHGSAANGIDIIGDDVIAMGNTLKDTHNRGFYVSGDRAKLLYNTVEDAVTTSAGYIQVVGADATLVGNSLQATSAAMSETGIRIESNPVAIFGNTIRNLTDFSWVGAAKHDCSLFANHTESGDRRMFNTTSVPSFSAGSRPSASDYQAGQIVFNSTTRELNTSDGSAWYKADGTLA